MMVSEATRHVQAPPVDATAPPAAAPSLPTTTTAAASLEATSSTAIAFPSSLTTTFGDTLMVDAASFPFDEQMMAMPAELTDPAAAAAAAAAIGASFFIDTAAIAQQIAMAVTDEKKLSDNILDLIPPPQSTVSATATATAVATTATTISTNAAGAAASLTMPLGPPPGLMDMRALSPPMSLMPDFSQAVGMTALSLDAAAATVTAEAIPVAARPAAIAPSTATRTSAASVAAVAAAAAASAEDRRRAASAYAASSLLKKRKSNDAFDSDAPVHDSVGLLPTSSYIPPTPSAVTTPATSSLTPSATTPTTSAAAAAAANLQNLQTLAREKVMKEPQSGDLYECVITKRNGGLGLTLACVDDHVQITGLAPDTPAANSGICVGDTLVAVSGLPVRGLQFSTVIGRLKSSSRNSVVLKLRRNPFRHNANGNGLPYRNGNGVVGSALKRPARQLTKTPESNSANVLTATKSMALETRLAGPSVPSTPSATNLAIANGLDHNTSTSSTTAFHVKTEPTQSAYFTPETAKLSLTTMNMSTTTPGPQWRVAEEDRDRYYAECRRLRQELSHAATWRRRERNATGLLHEQFQAIAHKFESEMQTIFQIGASTSSAAAGSSNGTTSSTTGACGAVVDSSSVAKAHHEDLVALRQKLLEVNHALARQQTEIMELKERDARHAFHEMRRIKAEIITEIQKRMQEMVMTSVSQLKGPGEPLTKPCFERIEGVRASVFENLFQQQSTASVASKLLASRHLHHHHHHHHRSSSLTSSGSSNGMHVKEEKSASIELELDATQAMQVLSWNLQERLPARSLAVQVMGGFKVEYVTHEEALTLRYQLQLVEEKP